MKSKNKVERFDYSKYESEPHFSDPCLQELEFWGIFKDKGGRIQVDVERYTSSCEYVGITEFIPEGLLEFNSKDLFIPKKKKREDYAVNIFLDLLNEFELDWNKEYKPIFEMIETPKDVYDSVRLNELCYTSDPDDLEDIEFSALMASIKRQNKYARVIQSLKCQFITKLATEVDRITLIVMSKLGYKEKDFDYNDFINFTSFLAKGKESIKISELKKYDAYRMMRKINNFLKHNTISSYEELKSKYPANVASIEKGTAKVKYENGMYAGDWIIVKDKYIEELIKKLKKFFKDYCEKFLDETEEEASWNYDEYFLDAYKKLKNPDEYFGIW